MRRNASSWILMIVITALTAGCSSSYSMRKGAAEAHYASARGPQQMPSVQAIGGGLESDAADFDGEDMRYAQLDEGVLRGDAQLGQPPPPPPQIAPSPSPVGPPPNKLAKPMLIYTGKVTMAVFETRKSVDSVHEMAKAMGGYLVRRSDTQITIRVPSEKFADALAKIEAFGDVLHRDETVRDVTEEFYDLKTRLDNARATRDRLQKLLDQAADVKDVLAIEKELSRVTEYIERMEGKLKRMRELVAFSTITVDFRAKGDAIVDTSVKLPFEWLDSLGLTELLDL